MAQDVGPESVNDAWFFEDLDIFFNSAVDAFRSGPHFLDGVIALRPPWNFIDQTRMLFDRHVLCKTGSIEDMRTLGNGFHTSIIGRLCRAFKKGGSKAIRIKKRGRPTGGCRTLNPEQEKIIQKTVYDKCPDQLKLPFALWPRIAVQQLIKQLWSIDMPWVSTLAAGDLRHKNPYVGPINRILRQLKGGWK